MDNMRVIDDIFNIMKAESKATETAARERSIVPTAGATVSAMENGTSSANLPALPAQAGEPTEVILYGFGGDFQYAAIDYYERVSEGTVYEDYDRHPPHPRYSQTLSLGRATAQRSLSQAALAKKNRYVGGEHWIKVTFDSAEAAERACYASPHVIHGYLVHAERYRGAGPSADAAIPATPAAVASAATSPSRLSSATLPAQSRGSPSSETASSATATGARPDGAASAAGRRAPQLAFGAVPGGLADDELASASSSSLAAQGTARQLQQQQQRQPPAAAAAPAPLRVRGARRAVLLPADQALLPVAPIWQRTFGGWPLVGRLFGGGSEIIGSQVPRRDDGGFDWEHASFYWRFWAWVDGVFGWDLCGIRGED